jgi:hypothetical protein
VYARCAPRLFSRTDLRVCVSGTARRVLVVCDLLAKRKELVFGMNETVFKQLFCFWEGQAMVVDPFETRLTLFDPHPPNDFLSTRGFKLCIKRSSQQS